MTDAEIEALRHEYNEIEKGKNLRHRELIASIYHASGRFGTVTADDLIENDSTPKEPPSQMDIWRTIQSCAVKK